MPRIQVGALQCYWCKHVWLPEGRRLPKQCPSRKCRRRDWNYGSEKAEPVVDWGA